MTDLTALPVPSPPSTKTKLNKHEEKSESLMRCPVCRTKRKNETLVPISGYVYCYKCIVSYLRRDETKDSCPMTGLPVTEDSLIRIFPPGSE